MMSIKYCLVAAASTLGMLTLTQPAQALTFRFSFSNVSGTEVGGFVEGFIEYDPLLAVPDATNVPAIDFQVTDSNLTNYLAGNGGIEVGVNLISTFGAANNVTNFDGAGAIDDFFLTVNTGTETIDFGRGAPTGFTLSSFATSDSFTNTIVDINSTTLVVTQATAVPFEFSPGMGLVLAGGFLAGSRVLKQRKNNKLTK